MAGNDKKLYKQLSHQEGQGSSNPQALSPPQTFVGSPVTTISSPTTTGVPPVFVRMTSNTSVSGKNSGPQLCDTISSKTLFYLRSTLTASFHPDYDFTDAKSEEFSREPNVKLVKDAVRANLSALAGDMFVSLEPQLWAAIDEEIKLSDCDIYRYSVIFECVVPDNIVLKDVYEFLSKLYKRLVYLVYCSTIHKELLLSDNSLIPRLSLPRQG